MEPVASPTPTLTPTPTPSPWIRTVAIAAVLVLVAGAALAYALTRSPSHRPVAAAPSTSSPPQPSTPAAPPPAPTVPHDVVKAAAPTAFTLAGPAFTIKAHVCSMAPAFPLDPPGEQHHTVCWVQKGFGVRPSSDSATSYVLGHSWGQDDQEVLNKASEAATRQILKERTKPVKRDGVPTYPVHALDGYRLVLRTPNGTLTYKVSDAYGVAKNQLGLVKSTMDQKVRNRVVVITCAELKHTDYEYNVIINAYLWSSSASTAAPTA